MIPKKIHYCWYGGKKINAEYQRYIDDWKVKNPDYEVFLWNEDNSPMHLPYMENALRHGLWANLSNFMRLHVLYLEGGIYLDTDIEVLKSFDDLLVNSCFVGFESGAGQGEPLLINNAVLGSIPGHPFVKQCKNFLLNNFDGAERPPDSSPVMTTKILRELGVHSYGDQIVGDVRIFPAEYFYPVEYGKDDMSRVTSDSYTIHHWAATWKGEKKKRPVFRAVWDSVSYRIKEAMQKILSADLPGFSELTDLFYSVQTRRLLRSLSTEDAILHGPFKGMKFPGRKKLPSYYPKLIGSYEYCLQPVIHELLDRDYETIINPGCAEGFYAVGLARLFPKAIVYAYDLKPEAVAMTSNTAAENKLQNKIQVFQRPLTAGELSAFPFKGRALIVCDIEGGEKGLFTRDNVSSLKNADLIVELHNFIDPSIKEYITDLFAASHNITIVPEVTIDFGKFPTLGKLPVETALKLVNEKRPVPMEWAIMRSKAE